MKIRAFQILKSTLGKEFQESSQAEERKATLDDFLHRYEKAQFGWPFSSMDAETLSSRLEKFFHKDRTAWIVQLDMVLRELRKGLVLDYRSWRKRNKSSANDFFREELQQKNRPIFPLFGISYEGLEELTESKKIIQSWMTVSGMKKSDPKANLAKRIQGEYAIALREHIDAKKEDRLKKGSDAIVMHALGYEFVETNHLGEPVDRKFQTINKEAIQKGEIRIHDFLRTGYSNPRIRRGRWVKLYPSCDVIVFEDLTRYRTQMDRPKKENGRLMQWSHRSIIPAVKEQAKLYGLCIGEVGAAYSSKFYAKTQAPGIRGSFFSKEKVELILNQIRSAKNIASESKTISRWQEAAHEWPLIQLKNTASVTEENLLKILHQMKPGSEVLFPEEGGEYFITMDDSGNLVYLNADLNAAQNLGRRFLTRYANPNKITMQEDRENQILILDRKGKRIQRQMPDMKSIQVYFLNEEKEEERDFTKALETKSFSFELELISRERKSKKQDSNRTELDHEDDHDLFGFYSCFRDLSGHVIQNKNRFYSAKIFWGMVKSILGNKLFQDGHIILRSKTESVT